MAKRLGRASDDMQFYTRDPQLFGNAAVDTPEGARYMNGAPVVDQRLPETPLYPALTEEKLRTYLQKHRNELIAGFRKLA